MAAPIKSTDMTQGSQSTIVDVQDGDDACPTSQEDVRLPGSPVHASNKFCPTINRTELFHLDLREFTCFHRTEVFNQGVFSPFDIPNGITSLLNHRISPTAWLCSQYDVHRTKLFRLVNRAPPTTKKKKRTHPTRKWFHGTGVNHTTRPPDPASGRGNCYFVSLLLASFVVCYMIIAHRYPLDAVATGGGVEQAAFVYIAPSPSILWTLRRYEGSRPHPPLEIELQDIDHGGTAEVDSTSHVDATLPTTAHASILPSPAQGRREGAMTGGQNGGMVVDLAMPTELRLEEMVTGRRSQVKVTDPIVATATAGIVSKLDCQGIILKKDERNGDMNHVMSHVDVDIAERDGDVDHVMSHGGMKIDEQNDDMDHVMSHMDVEIDERDGDIDRVTSDSSTENDELFDTKTGTATKVSAEGHKAAWSYSYSKPGVQQVGMVSCFYLPNPTPNTTRVQHRHTTDTTVTEVGVGILQENGLIANVCVVESAGMDEDLELLPPLAEDGVNNHPQLVDEQVALFDNSEHNLRPFLASYGPQDEMN